MSGKPQSPGLVPPCLLGGKIPEEELTAYAPYRVTVGKEQPPAMGRGGGSHRLCSLPGPSSASFPALGRREQGAAPVASGEGRGGGGATGSGQSPSQRLAWSRLLLKWVRSLPCTNAGLSPAPPKYTESWRQSWPQCRPWGLCLVLPGRLGFHVLQAARVGVGWTQVAFPWEAAAASLGTCIHCSITHPASCTTGMLCPLCTCCSSVSSSLRASHKPPSALCCCLVAAQLV